MAEINDERLAELEALEQVVKHCILPRAKLAGTDAERERVWKHPNDMPYEETRKRMQGSAMWDNPPKEWTKSKVATWSRGYLYGRETVGMNLGQHFYWIVQACLDPVEFWKRHRLGFLELCMGSRCSCGGCYAVEERRVGLECDQCHAFLTYEQVCEVVREQENRKGAAV